MRLAAGARVGPYEVLAALGAGGMGEVYRARDTRLGREVALKVISDGAALDPERLQRFEQEARLAGSLNHPNLMSGPKDVVAAVVAAESLGSEALEAVARAKNMTPLALRTSLLSKLHELAQGGDLQALELLLERTSGAALGPVERVRSAKRLARRVEKALGAGLISIAEAQKLTALVRVRRELEHDDLDRRLAEVEGGVWSVRSDGGSPQGSPWSVVAHHERREAAHAPGAGRGAAGPARAAHLRLHAEARRDEASRVRRGRGP